MKEEIAPQQPQGEKLIESEWDGIVRGKDAKRFIEVTKNAEPLPEKERKRIRENYELLSKLEQNLMDKAITYAKRREKEEYSHFLDDHEDKHAYGKYCAFAEVVQELEMLNQKQL